MPTALVVQEAHRRRAVYDPWGLELAPLGLSLPNPSRELFNGGSERERGLSSLTDLHWDCASADETPFRPYDAQLGLAVREASMGWTCWRLNLLASPRCTLGTIIRSCSMTRRG